MAGPRKVNVQPTHDQNGVELPANYLATPRENLGSPADFRTVAEGRTIETPMAVRKLVNGFPVDEMVTHTATRQDF